MLDHARYLLGKALMHGVMRRLAAQGHHLPALLMDPANKEDPYPLYERLHAEGPLLGTGMAIATSKDLVDGIYRDPRFGHPDPDAKVPLLGRIMDVNNVKGLVHPVRPPSMIVINPPDHTRYRRLVSKAFTIKTVEALRPRVRRIADDLLSTMVTQPEPDLMRDFAGALPVIVIAELLGVDPAMHPQFRAWGFDVARTLDNDLTFQEIQAAARSLRALNRYFADEFEDRRRNPREDLMTALVQAEFEGSRLSDTELLATALILLVAGFETTVNLIGNGARLLLDHPDQLQELIADRTLWPQAIDEILRIDSPIQMTSRTALEDVEVRGHAFPKGSTVMLLIGCANRDPKAFTDPAAFDIHRDNANEHIAFAGGIHFCLGAALARLEGEVALEALFDHCPGLRATGPSVRRGSPLLRGFVEFPVAVVPSSADAASPSFV
jgi:cytochrome P450